VEKDLEKKYSPEQIAGRLRAEFPDDPEMLVSHETIYLATQRPAGAQALGQLARQRTTRLHIPPTAHSTWATAVSRVRPGVGPVVRPVVGAVIAGTCFGWWPPGGLSTRR
jgi:IS30 family transposase